MRILTITFLALLPLAACDSGDGRGDEESTVGGGDDDTGGEQIGGSDGVVTWHGDVQPLLAEHCTRCHFAGGLGVGDFTDLSVVQSFAEPMLAAIEDGRMPPPASDPDCRDYSGSDGLTVSDRERETFAAWLDAGLPEGDPSEAPDFTPVSDQLADPDLTVMMPAPYVPTYSDEANPGNEYRCFLLERPAEGAFYITSLAPIIDQRAISHHAVLFTMSDGVIPDELRRPEGMDCISSLVEESLSGMLTAWAPGMLPIELPEGKGLYVGASEQLILQMHYFYSGPDTEGVADQSGYAFRTAEDVDTPVFVAPVGLYSFQIPADDDDYTDGGSYYNSYFDLEIYGIFPHMHVLGQRYTASISHADGEETCLVEGDYDFDNQMTYQFTEPVAFNTGDSVQFSCNWNNSTSNPDLIHDTPRTTGYGERTDEEMCFFFTMLAFK